jgi:diguanylate cyclase
MGGYVNRLRTRLAESNGQLEGALERIRDIAVRDELTGTYNRRFLMGHAAGDDVLRHVAAILGRGLRGSDVFGRFGGEELLLVLPDTDPAGAKVLAERIRAAVAAETRVTVTIGVAQYAGGSAAAVLARADQALYRGKAAGRNAVLG